MLKHPAGSREMPVLMTTSDGALRRTRSAGHHLAGSALHDLLQQFPLEPACVTHEPRIIELGAMRIGRIGCIPALIRRETPVASAQRERGAVMLFQLSGRSRFDQLGRSADMVGGMPACATWRHPSTSGSSMPATCW